MNAAITATALAKRYRLGTGYRHTTARDALAAAVARAAGRGDRPVFERREIWALRDGWFEIEPGGSVAFIGRNGAGKSTLLKILSRITKPTAGYADVRGRVGSLLEVGTGFHAELTGRENVYLNGAILGMRKAEIDRRFDEIVDFAEVETFLDTPVKRYSSGMTVRLAFAVAAHLEPEIMLVDEVLAVGDIAFQRKCLGKMSSVATEGRTVVFVSHNMAIIQALCQRGIFLDRGSIKADTGVADAVSEYLTSLEQQAVSQDLDRRTDREGWQEIKVRRIEIDGAGASQRAPGTGRPARFAFELTGTQRKTECSFTLYDQLGRPVATLSSAHGAHADESTAAVPRFGCVVDELVLVPGRYRVDVSVHGGGHLQDHVEGAAFFDVGDGVLRGRPVSRGEGQGVVALVSTWTGPAA